MVFSLCLIVCWYGIESKKAQYYIFSLIVKHDPSRLGIALVLSQNVELETLHMMISFLQGHLEEDILMCQLENWVNYVFCPPTISVFWF